VPGQPFSGRSRRGESQRCRAAPTRSRGKRQSSRHWATSRAGCPPPIPRASPSSSRALP